MSALDQSNYFQPLSSAEFDRASHVLVPIARRLHPAFGAFSEHFPLELGKGRHNLHHHSTIWRGGVNGFGKALEYRSCLVNLLHQQQHVLDQ